MGPKMMMHLRVFSKHTGHCGLLNSKQNNSPMKILTHITSISFHLICILPVRKPTKDSQVTNLDATYLQIQFWVGWLKDSNFIRQMRTRVPGFPPPNC